MSRFFEELLGIGILSGMFYMTDKMARKDERAKFEDGLNQMARDYEVQKMREELEALKRARA